jgi:hypothetical protein
MRRLAAPKRVWNRSNRAWQVRKTPFVDDRYTKSTHVQQRGLERPWAFASIIACSATRYSACSTKRCFVSAGSGAVRPESTGNRSRLAIA